MRHTGRPMMRRWFSGMCLILIGGLCGGLFGIHYLVSYGDGLVSQWTWQDAGQSVWDCTQVRGFKARCFRLHDGELRLPDDIPTSLRCVVRETVVRDE